MTEWRVIHGDALDRLRALDAASVDAVVTDPPYGLEFMGAEWDRFKPSEARIRTRADGRTNPTEGKSVTVTPESYIAGRPFQDWCEAWAAEVRRVLKPGGYLVSFGGQRTYHRLASGIEDARFEIRDCLQWLFGSGFPKSADPLLAMRSLPRDMTRAEFRHWHRLTRVMGGTALKPAYEPIVLARKPPVGTVAQNMAEHRTGALNVDGCRVAGAVPSTVQGQSTRQGEVFGTDQRDRRQFVGHDLGRWPANVVLDPEAAAMLDDQTGDLGRSVGGRVGNAGGGAVANVPVGEYAPGDPGYGDSGGASRFLYVAKATSAERHFAGRNGHPTVKPIALMEWLIRLVTPPGGTVLDPFTGSGTTGIAALREGMGFVGIEREPGYCELARERIRQDMPLIAAALEVAA